MVSEQDFYDFEVNDSSVDLAQSPEQYLKQLFEIDFPLGLFYRNTEEDNVFINTQLAAILRLPSQERHELSFSDFREQIIFLSADPELASNELDKIDSGPQMGQDITIVIRGGGYYKLLLSPMENARGSSAIWGILVDFSTEGEKLEYRLEILKDLFQTSRKLSAAASGNLNALSSNIHTWTKDVVDDFLFEARDQLQAINDNLDLAINLTTVMKTGSVFPEYISLKDFLEVIKGTYHRVEIHLSEIDDQEISSSSLYLDPVLWRLAFSNLMDEIVSRTLTEQSIEIVVSKENEKIQILIHGGRTLPLPGLNTADEFPQLEPLLPEFHLAETIITAHGGEIRIDKNPIEQGTGIGITLSMPVKFDPQETRASSRISSISQENKARILLVEAEADYQLRVNNALTTRGYRVDLAGEGNAALDMVQRINPDAVLIARNLPGMSGIIVTQGIRRWSAVPVIMLSDRKGADDLPQAFRAGVDDYLTKPFTIEELVFRLEANLRRSHQESQSILPDIYQDGDIRINYSTRQVWRKGVPVKLTPIEYNLLVYMSRQGQQIMTYEQLLERVWEGPEKGTRQGLFVHIRRLREKIEADPDNPLIITNKWGVGYMFSPKQL